MPIFPYERSGIVAKQGYLAYNSTFMEAQREEGPSEFLNYDQLEELRSRGAEIGERVRIHRDAKIDFPQKLKLGDDVLIGPDVRIRAAGEVHIHDRAILEPGVQVISSVPNVPTGRLRIGESTMKSLETVIGEDCLIGTSTIIMPGATVYVGSIVMPGSMIDRSVPPSSLARPGAPFQTSNRNRPRY